jgi:hypothetical protein
MVLAALSEVVRRLILVLLIYSSLVRSTISAAVLELKPFSKSEDLAPTPKTSGNIMEFVGLSGIQG